MRTRRSLALAFALGTALVGCSWIVGVSGDVELRSVDGGDDGGMLGFDVLAEAADDAPASDAPGRDGESDADADAGTEGGAVDAGPIAFQQVNAVNFGNKASGTIPFLKDVHAHSAIVLALVLDTATSLVGITDTRGNTYKLAVGPHDANGLRTFVAIAPDTSAGPCSITITMSVAPSTYFDVYVHEYAGIATTGALDVSRVADGTSNAVDGMRSGTGTIASGNELIFGFGVSGTVGVGTGFTSRSAFDGNLTEDRVVASAGSYETLATMTSGGCWTMTMVTLRGN